MGENCNGKESCGNVQHLTAVNTQKKTRRSLESSTAADDSKDNSREASAFTKNVPKSTQKSASYSKLRVLSVKLIHSSLFGTHLLSYERLSLSTIKSR
jgi:hypothetical protein